MNYESLNAEEQEAVDRVLGTFHSMKQRGYGEDPEYLRDFETALLGYRSFAERLAGDTLRKIDYVLHPMLADLKEGEELKLKGVTFSHVKRGDDGYLSATAVDDEGTQRFRINWKKDSSSRAAAGDKEKLSVAIQSCPADRPQYEYAETIASAVLLRTPGDRINTTSNGLLWSPNFFEFMDAMDVLRPALAGKIRKVPKQKREESYLKLSYEEMDKAQVSNISKLDGGLPGERVRLVVNTMLKDRGTVILSSLAERSEQLAQWLEDQGCVWGGAAQTTQGRDNVMYAVRSEETGKLALLFNARNNCGPHNIFLAWKNPEDGTASLVAAKGGKHVFRTVESFLKGEVPEEAPMATINLATGEHDIGPEIVGTAAIDLALLYVRFTEEYLAEIADGEATMDDYFERVDDFKFYIEANEDFYLDAEDEDNAVASAL